MTEHGAPPHPGFTEVWTGTGSSGSPDDPTDPLGTSSPVWGNAKSAASNWIDTGGYYRAPGNHTLYAMSGVLTVLAGDLNHDGVVNGLDLSFVASHGLQSGVKTTSLDFSLISSNWLRNAGGGSGDGVSSPAAA